MLNSLWYEWGEPVHINVNHDRFEWNLNKIVCQLMLNVTHLLLWKNLKEIAKMLSVSKDITVFEIDGWLMKQECYFIRVIAKQAIVV